MPVTPELAATVMLLREGPVSPEVLMIERHSRSDFLPDLYVFPGGRVEKQDHELGDRVVGVSPEDAVEMLGEVPRESAQALFVAAIRETFEEAGILLASPRGRSKMLGPDEVREITSHRLEVQAGNTTFREIIERYDLELAADRLSVHGRWITPEEVPKRFDTLFFLALYSFCKRFTALAHVVLGICLAAAPIGAWIALRGDVGWPVIALGLAVLFWVSGFDIFYALQDLDYDRERGLHSIPAKLGAERSIALVRVFHVLMVLLLLLLMAGTIISLKRKAVAV